MSLEENLIALENFLTEGRIDEAFAIAQQLYPTNSDNAIVHYYYAVLNAEKGEFDLAMNELRRLIEAHPEFEPGKNALVNLLFRAAEGLFEAQAYEEAMPFLNELMGLAPAFIGSYLMAAAICDAVGQREDAEKFLLIAHDIDPNDRNVVELLFQLTQDPIWKQKFEELRNRKIRLQARQYFSDMVNNAPVVNQEYVKFEISLTGDVVGAEVQPPQRPGDPPMEIVYLAGSFSPDDLVICVLDPKTRGAISGLRNGSTIQINGACLGNGPEVSGPLLINCTIGLALL